MQITIASLLHEFGETRTLRARKGLRRRNQHHERRTLQPLSAYLGQGQCQVTIAHQVQGQAVDRVKAPIQIAVRLKMRRIDVGQTIRRTHFAHRLNEPAIGKQVAGLPTQATAASQRDCQQEGHPTQPRAQTPHQTQQCDTERQAGRLPPAGLGLLGRCAR